ncbi:Cro/CI family transcriptional regulator [Methylophaga sp. OBS4]|uniref:Cro/CI family transcriptional regulator n=1 Tax=Methylophaga sp. OBS4 TaxID=2991935 RepID=UPI002250F7C9|nr:Cro/CI family transcriptional regulator [Methylophaga sp. OBS4]MCX4186747.1 Cro/CI family transcriptional regulator [Methylophaga sp. OBS4]
MTKDQAIKHFGGASKLANALGITKQAVNNWDDIPDVRQYQIQVLTDGALKADRKKLSAA